jgi:hypothetical protein
MIKRLEAWGRDALAACKSFLDGVATGFLVVWFLLRSLEKMGTALVIGVLVIIAL